MNFKHELPSPEWETLEPTMCDTHVSKRLEIAPTDLERVNAFEKEKNCCLACETKRVKIWGKPTDDDIKQKTELYKQNRQLIDNIKRYALARDNNDLDTLDQMTWAQFKDCENGSPFWTSEDYKKLLNKLGEE